MTIAIAILLVCVAVAGWTAYPLLKPEADRYRGEGQEADDRVAVWTQEKNRLVGDMVALDVAYSEARISDEDYNAQRSLVMSEAEKAAARLGELRSSSGSGAATSRTYPRLAWGFASLVIICGTALTVLLNDLDKRSDVNPHANGSIPLPANTTAGGASAAGPRQAGAGGGSGAPVHADGTPDVGAMVARLEARVKGADASVDDIIMLARSYRVLNREADLLDLYRKAQAMAPQDDALKLVLASALIRSESDANRQEGEKVVDGILQKEPKKPEALWLKSLGLIHRHEIVQARDTLNELTQLVGENADAKKAVNELLASLSTAAATVPPSGTAQSPAGQPTDENGGKK